VSFAKSLTGVGALVGSSAYVLGHLGLQHLLHRPLDDLLREAGVVHQNLLR
jgi:hypothetical protein